MQVQRQAPNIKRLLDSSNSFYQDLLGYKPEQTFLEQIPEIQWNKFAEQRGLNHNSSGIYLPRNQTAVIQEENSLSLFHEYFGHGLYCEQSLIGRRLVDLERRLLEEEKQEFQAKQFNLKDIQRFRQQNKTFQELDEFRRQNLAQYELFAIFTEFLLSREFGLREMFERKYDSLSEQDKRAISSMINFSQQYGDLATFYAQGLARRTTSERVKRLLEEVYGKKAVDNSKLILLTGSKKPFSDIDLFASSDYLQSSQNDWLDLVVFNKGDFEKRLTLFDIQLTHPILTGEFVCGDKTYLDYWKQRLLEQPITEEAIQFNLQRAETNKEFADKSNSKKDKEDSLSYFNSYLRNARSLEQGNRNGLILNSQSETNIQLKGGTE